MDFFSRVKCFSRLRSPATLKQSGSEHVGREDATAHAITVWITTEQRKEKGKRERHAGIGSEQMEKKDGRRSATEQQRERRLKRVSWSDFLVKVRKTFSANGSVQQR